MLQVLGRFFIGFIVGAAFSLFYFSIARSFSLTTIQLPESEPHYVVLYAGCPSEAALATICLLPVMLGVVTTLVVKQELQKWIVAALAIFAARACVGIAGSFYAIIGDSLLLGMD